MARSSTPDAKLDGRHERSKRTQHAIVTALTELLDQGQIEPTGAEIAARANVALRSIAVHFPTREALLLAVAEHHTKRLPHPELDPKAPFEQRLESFVASRAAVLEASRAMRAAASVVRARSPVVERALLRTAKERRLEAARVFATEIAAANKANRVSVERGLALITSGRGWDGLRVDLGLSVRAAREEMAVLIRTLLKA